MKNMIVVDNRANIYENPDKFHRSLVKRLNIKFLYPMKRFNQNVIIQNKKLLLKANWKTHSGKHIHGNTFGNTYVERHSSF